MKTIVFPTLKKGYINNGNIIWKALEAAGYSVGSNGWASHAIQELVEMDYEVATISLQELGLVKGLVTMNQIQEKVVAMGWGFFCPFTHYCDQKPEWVAIVTAFNESGFPNVITRHAVPPTESYLWKRDNSVVIFRKVTKVSSAQDEQKGSEVVTK